MMPTKLVFVLAGLLTPGLLLAEATTGSDGLMDSLKPLIQVGAVGAILAFFLVKLEPRLRAIEMAIYTLSRGQMLLLLNSENADIAIKKAAQEIKCEVESKLPKNEGANS
jgi:hypothetical protein